jgi:hypothetical protein
MRTTATTTATTTTTTTTTTPTTHVEWHFVESLVATLPYIACANCALESHVIFFLPCGGPSFEFCWCWHVASRAVDGGFLKAIDVWMWLASWSSRSYQ